MQFQFASDLHLEFVTGTIDQIIEPSAPYLALLGDIGYPFSDIYQEFIGWCSKMFTKIFIISGNHEYYVQHISARPTMNEIDNQIQKVCSLYPNVIFLNNSLCQLTDDIIILGTTLWSFIPPNDRPIIKHFMNDYRNIYALNDTGKHRILVTPVDTTSIHVENVKWLNEQLNQHTNKTIIVLTHHLPSFKLINEKYANEPSNSGFASNLDHLMENHTNIKYWLCGHTHSCAKVMIGSTTCLINPCGYPGENDKFDKKAVIDLTV